MHGHWSNSIIFRENLLVAKVWGQNGGIIKTTLISWVSHLDRDARKSLPSISDETDALWRFSCGREFCPFIMSKTTSINLQEFVSHQFLEMCLRHRTNSDSL